MIGPVVSGAPVLSPVMLIGQAPGAHEGPAGRPFAWTAGKTLFRWFGEVGISEAEFRERVYMAAVCRCFPGKGAKGGDRVPSADEIARCGTHLAAEVALLRPALIIPVGKLAIAQVIDGFTASTPLTEVVGRVHAVTWHGVATELAPLPHPSGASTWHRTEPGKTLLAAALRAIGRHPAFRAIAA
ncbi:MAG: uracil-DNA glycosylase family protein, partial [Myxococcales bacterium]|nr:uracil-DNA glycosylase family protein [Myxococcales bacterium]